MAKSTKQVLTIRNVEKSKVAILNEMKGTQKDAFNQLIENQKVISELGLNDTLISKLNLALKIKNEGKESNEKVTLKGLFEGMITNLLSNEVKASELNKSDVIADKKIKAVGSAKIRIAHFVKQVKEHNSKSSHTLKINQTLISKGLGSKYNPEKPTQKNKSDLDLSLLKCNDVDLLVSGTNANRKAIKTYLIENNNFVSYNDSLGNKSSRIHNTQSLKNLYKF